MRAKVLDPSLSTPAQDWTAVTDVLEGGVSQAPDTGGPDRHTTWLTTLNADGSPHVTSVGAVWVDGAFSFQTGDTTRKAKNLSRDPRCAMSVSVRDFDLVIEGRAEKVDDPAAVARVVAAWNAGGWPCEVDSSGTGITAPFNAPAVGPAPWFVYTIRATSATAVTNVDPGGSTRWTF